jgi:hypothetical protein
MTSQIRLIGLFILLGKHDTTDRHDYPTSLSLNVNILAWMHDVDHPCFKLLEADIMLMNEEQGELTFSVLARGLHANPGRSHVDQVSNDKTANEDCQRPRCGLCHERPGVR